MPTVSTTRTWVARDALVILSQASSISLAANTISGAFSAGTRFETVAKNVAITPPDSAWEQQSFLGEDSNGFQNQILDEKPVGLATFTGTLVLGEDETIENFMVSGSSAISGTHTRYQIGKNNDNEIAVAVIIRDKEIFFLETNTIPGMTANSLCPKSAQADGLNFSDLLDKIIELALKK